MGISELRQAGPSLAFERAGRNALENDLVLRGGLDPDALAHARIVQAHCDTSIDRILLAENLMTPDDILAAQARLYRSRPLSRADVAKLEPAAVPCAPQLLVKHVILPVLDRDGTLALVVGAPCDLDAALPDLPAGLHRARRLVADRDVVLDRLADIRRVPLTQAAQARVPEHESCRAFGQNRGRRLALVCAALSLVAICTFLWPVVVLAIIMGWSAITLFVAAGFRCMAFVARISGGPVQPEMGGAGLKPPLPRVSVLVPLFRETEIAHALIARLTQLTYPKCLLDVVLVLEEDDALTRQTLAQIDLPPWIRAVVVPDGTPRTKPRAMNYALDFCDGDIVGIFDAEDAPEADQITRVARAFQAAPPDVVCLQGVLDYYNSQQNWLARCFTIEYAAWFRIMLPGLTRLGMAIPLGGTTLYFRRSVLEELGGWDAHNVTEDADLGFRLARHGYRTQMVATTTFEEANCHPWAWIKQRSRWLKGYMFTYLVHMRRPCVLYQQLGARQFWGFQAHFVSALSQILLAPILWSCWLVFLGLPHPLDPVVPRGLLIGCTALFLAIETISLIIYAVSVTAPERRHLLAWVPTMPLYYPLSCIAAYKALYELFAKPFFWDKTMHGLSLAVVPPPTALGFAGGRRSDHAAKLS